MRSRGLAIGRRLAVVVGALSLLASAASGVRAAEGMPPIPERTSYPAAREILAKNGYKPVDHTATAGRCSTLTTVCASYPETVACAATNAGICRFEWTRAGVAGAAVLETQGQTADGLVVIRTYEGNALASPYPLGVTN